MEFTLPEKWKDWEIEDILGEGSYGSVYSARNKQGEICAIKVIDLPKTKEEEDSLRREYGDEESVRTFYKNLVEDYEKEIELLNSLKNSQNIVRIYDHLKVEKGVGWRVFIRMECLQNFADYCDVHTLEEEQVIQFGIDICKALEECEQLNIIHRDLKPDNILINKDGVLKLCDFGLARRLDASMSAMGSYSLKGTYGYMAPEIYLGKKYNGQVDIYSLGLILYRLMNRNKEPFIPVDKNFVYYKDKEVALDRRMNGEAFQAPVDASENFANLILKACAFKLEDRYKTAAEMKKELLKLQRGLYKKEILSNTQKKGLGLALLLLSLACAGVFAYFWTQVWHVHGVKAKMDANKVLTVYGDSEVSAKDVQNYWDSAEKIVIKEGITAIGDNCFEGFVNVREVELADSVTEIGAVAFSGDSSLKNINLADSKVETIGAEAFSYCESLKDFSFPAEVTIAEDSVLTCCSNLTTICFNQVSELKQNSFSGCNALTKVEIPDGIVEIPADCFNDCESLTEVKLGSQTKSLGNNAFAYCAKLKTVDGLEQVTDYGDDVFGETALEKNLEDENGFSVFNGHLLRYSNKEKNKNIEIPENVEIIEASAFESNKVIETVIIGSNVKKVKSFAFRNSAVRNVIVNKIKTEVEKDAFADTPYEN